jgi:hypothetical protein
MAPGPFVLFILVPLLRTVAHPSGGVLPEAETLLSNFNEAASTLLRAYVGSVGGAGAGAGATAESRADLLNTRVLVSLTAAMGTPLSETQVRALLTHCATTDFSVEPNWAEMGVLPPPPTCEAKILTDRFGVNGRPATTYHVKVTPTASDWFNAYSYKGVEWAAIGLITPGTYIVYANDLGIAKAGTGDTSGRELTANLRITAGNDILPPARRGYSLAGESHEPRPSGTGWHYRTSTPLYLDTPLIVIVTHTTVSLLQAGALYLHMTKKSSEPALLAFKNLWLRVHYKKPEAPAPPPPAPVRVSTPVSSGRSWASIARTAPDAPPRSRTGAPTHEERVLDLPPTALMARLRDLAAAEC